MTADPAMTGKISPGEVTKRIDAFLSRPTPGKEEK